MKFIDLLLVQWAEPFCDCYLWQTLIYFCTIAAEHGSDGVRGLASYGISVNQPSLPSAMKGLMDFIVTDGGSGRGQIFQHSQQQIGVATTHSQSGHPPLNQRKLPDLCVYNDIRR